MEMEIDTKEEQITEYKVYKEKKYSNSNKEPFGITIHGRSKEYLVAHETLKGILVKKRIYDTKLGGIKVQNVTNDRGLFVAIIEVKDKKGKKGHVELKVHSPGKKGATIEMRKMSGFEYVYVELLKSMITMFLDGLIDGEDIQEIIKKSGNSTLNKAGVTSKPTLFRCDVCNFESQFASGLKIHKTRIHIQKEIIKCGQCDYKSVEEKDLANHIKSSHEQDKTELLTFVCTVCKLEADTEKKLDHHIESEHSKKVLSCDSCGFKTNDVNNMSQHTALLHKQNNKRENSFSPSSSPPRKKIEIHEEQEENEVDMIDLGIEAHDVVQKMLETRIKQLEKQVERDIVYKRILQEEIIKLKENLENAEKENLVKTEKVTTSRRPNCIGKVHEKHISLLRGYKLRYKATPDGACLTNCFAVHAYEDEEEGPRVKRMINNHMADNWENVYKDKIPLPYVETVGVGKSSKVITKSTKEEMIQFLRSDESLMVFSNSHELLAIATVFNININVFTFGGIEDTWSQITPEPSLIDDKALKLVPDMDLYHSFESHYDLLVKDESRIVNLGPLAGIVSKSHDQELKESQTWNIVKKRNHKDHKNNNIQAEKLLEEQNITINEKDDNMDEITLLESKKRGFKRQSPQESPINLEKETTILKCDKCESKLQSKGLLDAHMKSHEVTNFHCDQCELKFGSEKELKLHEKEDHEQEREPEQWNCNDCPFQANCASELMNHLKCMGHAPSKAEKDNRQIFKDFKQCHTCKREFDGFWNLMTHKKNAHPSKKRCRNFPGSCKHGKSCWWVHVEDMEIDQESENKNEMMKEMTFNCNVCGESFKEKSQLRRHIKAKHTESNQICEKYRKGQCDREPNDCWFLHKNDAASPEKQVFQQVSPNPYPPDQLSKMFWMMNNLMRKVEGMEKKVEGMEKSLEEIMI